VDERWQRLMETQGLWLSQLLWVSLAERVLCWLVAGCSLLAMLAGWSVAGWGAGSAAAVGHLLAGLAAAVAVSRRAAWIALAFVALSALNYALDRKSVV
jgi:hypothetical protein